MEKLTVIVGDDGWTKFEYEFGEGHVKTREGVLAYFEQWYDSLGEKKK